MTEANEEWYADAGENYVTNGPYKLSEWKHSDSIVLTKKMKIIGMQQMLMLILSILL